MNRTYIKDVKPGIVKIAGFCENIRNKKSMAFRLNFVPADKALEPADVDKFVKKVLNNLRFNLGIEMR